MYDIDRLRTALDGGGWHTLSELAGTVGCSPQTVSARIRDLRKPRYGSRVIDRRPAGIPGVFQYRMDPDARVEPARPDPTLAHTVILVGDPTTLVTAEVVLSCTECDWAYTLPEKSTVADASNALARHP